jgi:BirA family transcriptional regulator, biotin operon repressor / biotin---[acetyl-CoA-carboxylase] ligase
MGAVKSPYTDLERPPLNEAALNRALVRPGDLWTGIRVVAETGSTNADLVAEAASGAPEGTVIVAESQSAGRGRLDRAWSAPARSGLAFSVLLRPAVPVARLGWLPLLTGVAVTEALRRIAEVEARLKWPNDVLIDERKVAGILAERAGSAVVIGVGLNVSLDAAELPVPTATSLKLADAATTDRDPLLRAILRRLATVYTDWAGSGTDQVSPNAERAESGTVQVSPNLDPARPDTLRETYRELSATIGRRVRVELPDGVVVDGEARDVDDFGRIVVRTGDGDLALSAGDIVHLR